ncbi:MAG: glutamate 5-kinase [Ruminobacter sp.]|uniref:glutamate 5-kinase n=1 Tax=Ruminobacter sp. TaxID=2774296 RepID=UPI001B40D1AD|nr:glutamate 5-kinase [Ruminobacter sp.]MBP3749063.1 glutamate 5-kinase [Ruminobacter sp.]
MNAKTIVVKFGTSMLTSGTKRLDPAHMIEVVRVLTALAKKGHSIVVVSSGAVAAGREVLGYPDLPRTIANKQMLASVGQTFLMNTWQNLFEIYGLHIGQILLTRADLEDRERFLNARDTLGALIANDIIPIINENDAVATAEIKVGDNDNLSARVAILSDADMLILLTDQKGLYTADPRSNPDATLIRTVEKITPEIKALAGDSVSGLGTGGMATKLQAAEIATRSGIEVVIASGDDPRIIESIVNGDYTGTSFRPESDPLEGRKAWILAGPKPRCSIVVDDGAVTALKAKGSSLLPKGITGVEGEFLRGDVVNISDADGRVVAHGISRYTSAELNAICGHRSEEIEDILGYEHGQVAVHRDDLVVLE